MSAAARSKHSFLVLFLLAALLTVVGTASANPGDLDPTFGIGGKVENLQSNIDDLTLTQDGKIITVSVAYRPPQTPPGAYIPTTQVRRYNADGRPDPTFSIDLTRHAAADIVVQPDGKILLVGTTNLDGSGTGANFFVARFNADGSHDPSFGSDGSETVDFTGGNDSAQAVALRSDGKVVVVGNAGTRFAAVRFTTDGILDNTFSSDGKFTTRLAYGQHSVAGVVIQPSDDKIVIGGTVPGETSQDQSAFGFVRLNTDGTLDTAFDGDGKLRMPIAYEDEDYSGAYYPGMSGIVIQADGKIVSAGTLDRYSLGGRILIAARINQDGTLDGTFGDGGQSFVELNTGSFPYTFVNDVAFDSAERLVVAGGFTGKFGLARYTTGGILDATFGEGGIVTNSLGSAYTYASYTSVLMQPDGKILTAGWAQTYTQTGATLKNVLVRYRGGEAAPATNLPGEFTLLLPQADSVLEINRGFGTFTLVAADEADEYTVDFYQLSSNVRLGLTLSITVSPETVCQTVDYYGSNTCWLGLTAEQRALFTSGTYVWQVAAGNTVGSTEAKNGGFIFDLIAVPDEINLIGNSSFEAGTSSSVPYYWQSSVPLKDDKPICRKDESKKPVANTGKCAFQFTGSADESNYISQTPYWSTLESGDTLTLTAALNNKSALAKSKVVYAIIKYADNSIDRLVLRLPAVGTGYQIRSKALLLTKTPTTVTVELRDNKTNGVFLIDDVKLLVEPNLDALRARQPNLILLPAAPELRGSN